MIEPRTEDDASRDDVSLDVVATDRAAQDLGEQDLAAQDLAAHDVTAQAIARGARPASTPDAALQALFQDVEKRPWSHDFFALLRRIEGLSPHLPRLGRAARPSLEPIRLGEEAELDFAPAALAKLEPTGAGVPRLGVRFFGLLGPQGPLPLHLTEYARERQYQRNDPTLARFLDIFHHRLLMLFYRAWAQSQPAVQHDRPAADRYAAWLGAAAGLHGAWQPKDALPQTARLFNAGMMGSRGRHPEGLAKILSQHFQVAVRIDPHVPQWLPLEAEERTRLGFARNRGERIGLAPAALGRSTTVGTKTWDRQYRFRVVIGPLTREQYDRFLPDGSAWRPLNDWIRQYVGHSLRWDIQPVLERRAVPQASLGHQLRLGYTSWAGRTGRAMPANDRGDLRLRPWSVALGTAGRTHRTADTHTMRPPQGEQP